MKLTLSTFSCRMLVLLAIAAPAVFMTGRASATPLQPETLGLDEIESSSSAVNFASNTAEKLQLLLPEEQTQAKVKRPRPFVQENGPTFVRYIRPKLIESNPDLASPSAVDVFQSVVSEDALG